LGGGIGQPLRPSLRRPRQRGAAVAAVSSPVVVVARDTPAVEHGSHGGEATVIACGVALLAAAAAYGVATHGVGETLAMAKDAVEQFAALVDSLGPAGYVLYAVVYGAMEVLLLPATPLALTAGALFGEEAGTLCSAVGGLFGATAAFLIGRYVARDRVLALAKNTPQFAALDRAIGREGFKVCLLVNLSPAASLQNLLNYVYGITSIRLPEYALASGLALLPRTWATVTAGTMGRSLLEGEGQGGLVALGAGLAFALAATVYISRVANEALAEMQAEDAAEATAAEEEQAAAGLPPRR
jgi:uncharacterized membrane protein YdjX (TVP38/TMEM64 family)